MGEGRVVVRGRVPVPVCEGFLVRVPHDGRPEREALARRALKRVVGDDTGWRIRSVGRSSYDVDLRAPLGWEVSEAQAFEYARSLLKQRGVEDAEPAFVMPGIQPAIRPRAARDQGGLVLRGGPGMAVDPDPAWHVRRTRIDEVWAQSRGAGIVIGHPDTGYTLHPEIWDPGSPRVLRDLGFDYVDTDPDPLDDLSGTMLKLQFPGHGTSTAGVLMSDGGGRVAGVATEARLVPLRVSRSVIHLSMSNLVRSIERAVEQGCAVVSMSLGGPLGTRALHRAVQAATDRGVILLAAAGNYWPWVVYPAQYPEVVSVAASDSADRPWTYSASRETVHVTAPGAGIWVASWRRGLLPKPTVEPSSGTSFAVALTAGVAALWLAAHGREKLIAKYGAPGLSAVFQTLLRQRGVRTPPGWDTTLYGTGLIDAVKLLAAPLPSTVPLRLRLGAPPPPSAPSVGAGGNFAEQLLGNSQAAAVFVDELNFHLTLQPRLIDGLQRRTALGVRSGRLPARATERFSAGLRQALRLG